ncbi:MAG: hypothetical protein GY930_14625 [bacterium]|nr:hypothetical protein [bacterium]
MIAGTILVYMVAPRIHTRGRIGTAIIMTAVSNWLLLTTSFGGLDYVIHQQRSFGDEFYYVLYVFLLVAFFLPLARKAGYLATDEVSSRYSRVLAVDGSQGLLHLKPLVTVG